MNVLYVDADQLGEVLREIIAQLQGITIDGRFLPAEVHPTADYTFADEQGLVELVQRYDGAVLDWTTLFTGYPRFRIPTAISSDYRLRTFRCARCRTANFTASFGL